ncbi:MAG TPA: class I SAM-dependent methyltransferase [Candidatus Acidoferrum sp.]|nr:class I SAM-dependent methyltransferase [Candidatus Acidoferrum sp.]
MSKHSRPLSLQRPHATPRLETLSADWTEYELVDSGASRKLERFGNVTLVRPEPQATWPPTLPAESWNAAHGCFTQPRRSQPGEWKFSKPVPSRWVLKRKELTFWVQPTPSGHLGVFPDQASHWDWLAALVEAAPASPKVLCLFGYTGLATLAAAAAGAQVTHVDASRKAIHWARENQSLSQLSEHPIRWIVDDAQSFVAREIRRGHAYDGLILDPPRFGRGPKGEIWKLEDSLPVLLRQCRELLGASPLFVLLNTYTTVLTRGQTSEEALQLHAFLKEMLANYSATISAGELVLADSAGREISNSVFARAVIRTPLV